MKKDKQPYDPDAFYTYGGNGNNSSPYRVRINDEAYNLCSILVASKTIPEYKTVPDIIRDALYHRLHFVQERLEDPNFRSKFDYYRNLIETDEEFRMQQSLDKFIAECEGLLLEFRKYSTETNRVLERMNKVADDPYTPANKRDEIKRIIERNV